LDAVLLPLDDQNVSKIEGNDLKIWKAICPLRKTLESEIEQEGGGRTQSVATFPPSGDLDLFPDAFPEALPLPISQDNVADRNLIGLNIRRSSLQYSYFYPFRAESSLSQVVRGGD